VYPISLTATFEYNEIYLYQNTIYYIYGPIHILHTFRLGTSSSTRITFYRHVICCYVDYDGWSFMGVWKFSDKVTLKWYLYFWGLRLTISDGFRKSRRTLNCYTCLQRNWVFTRLKKSNKMQQYADIYLLVNYSTCFGRPLCPSSGVHKTVVRASGTRNTIWGASFLKHDRIRTGFGPYGPKPVLIE